MGKEGHFVRRTMARTMRSKPPTKGVVGAPPRGRPTFAGAYPHPTFLAYLTLTTPSLHLGRGGEARHPEVEVLT